jgi:hypothetical protein
VRYYDADTDGSYGGTNEGAHYYCQDANFNVTAITSNTGAVLERYAYSPYGEVTVLDENFAADADQISAIANTHLYTGRERDAETGLQLNRWRVSQELRDCFFLPGLVRHQAVTTLAMRHAPRRA